MCAQISDWHLTLLAVFLCSSGVNIYVDAGNYKLFE